MTYYAILKFKRRTRPAHIVKVPPALVKLFGVSSLFNHVEPMETATFFVQTLTKKRLPVSKDENLPFWEVTFYTKT